MAQHLEAGLTFDHKHFHAAVRDGRLNLLHVSDEAAHLNDFTSEFICVKQQWTFSVFFTELTPCLFFLRSSLGNTKDLRTTIPAHQVVNVLSLSETSNSMALYTDGLSSGREIMTVHDAWHVLFFNPFFWEQTGKHGLKLRGLCKGFRDSIPEQNAIEWAFSNVLIRKADIFRLFPLAVHDVVRMRSPLLFVDAFRLAVKKTHGFDFCIAVMREKSILLWNTAGFKREVLRSKLNEELKAGGVSWVVAGPLFEASISGKRGVDSARVWHFDCFIEDLPHWQTFRPSPGSPARTNYGLWEYETILFLLHEAVGFWYKGINRDVLCVVQEIRRARLSHASGRPVCTMHHQHIAGRKFLFGIVRFRSWNGLGN